MSVICPHHAYGEHIKLECSLCGAKYSTKNIDYIGARSVFPSSGGNSCECGYKLVHECSGETDWTSIDQELAMFRRQERSLASVEAILDSNYGKGIGGSLLVRYKNLFSKLTPEQASKIERTIYEHREGFSPDPRIAKEQAEARIEQINRELREAE